jgi:ABC-type Na+ efflux pump permease subunit
MSLRATWAIAQKDVLEALRTLRLLVFILLPIGFSVFYRAILASAGDITTARVAIYDAGRSRLPQMLAQTEGVRVIIVGSLEELERVVIGARAVGGIALPPGYDAALIADERPSLRLWVNGQLDVHVTQFIHLIEPALRALAGHHPPARIETLTVPGSDPISFDIERFLLIMFLTVELTMTAIMVPASMLVEEKTQGTLKAVLTAPASYADFVAGKGIAGLIYALLCGGIVLALNGGLSGNVGLTGVVLLLTSIFLVGVGLLLGVLFDSLAALNTWSFVALLPLTLPGVVVPATNLGLLNLGAAEWVLRVIPTYYTVDAMLYTVSGVVSARAVSIDVLVLSVSAFLLFAVTVTILRRREMWKG